MTTIQDIADKLGISKGTVSKALNNAPDISETLQKQVLETAVELGYTRLRRYKKPTRRLCVIVQKDNIEYLEPHHFAYDIIMGFRQMAEPAGYEVEIIPLDVKFQREITYDIFMLQNDFAGSFILGFSLGEPWMKEFSSSRTPAVLYDNHMIGNPNTAYVGIDNNEGMELAVGYLKKLGHQKIGYLSSALGSHIMQVRHRAFFQAMHSHGLKADSSYAGCSYYLSECMEKHLPRLLKEGMTAVICCQDTFASAAITQCQQMGYQVPRDISIVGFDDIPLAPYTSPPLTTVRQDRTELGKSGFYALSSLLNGVSIGTMLLHAELMARQSTAPVRSEEQDRRMAKE
ncbi:LacI family transcriptional regulator [Ruminococcus sp. CLA-AA-H200]|uniref:LacI family transcriptional regulator n=1 Tax=Ruminococcus turbiniformis TaxID=2881258 RepID=A0ABS8FWN6_9FIRM|nr:LacI family DNA-binding transcriptional regulator [Ruminococcus turbiniformis]MCC2254004.1 LacI family transcriptional regulator [Ruminococcus turbiniformis]